MVKGISDNPLYGVYWSVSIGHHNDKVKEGDHTLLGWCKPVLLCVRVRVYVFRGNFRVCEYKNHHCCQREDCSVKWLLLTIEKSWSKDDVFLFTGKPIIKNKLSILL